MTLWSVTGLYLRKCHAQRSNFKGDWIRKKRKTMKNKTKTMKKVKSHKKEKCTVLDKKEQKDGTE